ncbi:hypothetical protein AUR64_19310 [Haloprofundus marisrubri]|uniref:Photosynthesis system II assembly factor Ycf48/Hcf136-like domain-containing protein n=1 Tax=Haloprofundus marisrubri TaxID=1514971 RepID=A0A0W1R4Q6_9EURY|nr:hypothetical protein [Haloprofundus marisrubri]KTG08382.1 hypothetical protein AUR64_19310 [Haloprofundus marisrubri]
MSSNGRVRDFSKFYREYARGGVHAASAAAMTAFGLLTIYHEAFAVLAVLAYVVPALYVYAERDADGNHVEHREHSEHSSTTETTESQVSSAGSRENASDEKHRTEGVEGRRPKPSARPSSTSDPDGGEVDEPEAEIEAGTKAGSRRGDDAETIDSDPGTTDNDAGANDDASGDETAGDDRTWTTVESSVGIDFSDAVVAGDNAYAVGEDGRVLTRTDDGWSTVLADGPAAEGENLTGIDATTDGAAVWVAGDGGALGRIDTASNRHTDYSAPDGDTDSLTDLAISGRAGEETILLVNGSGAVRRGEYDGKGVRWDELQKPGSGSSFAAVAFADARRGYLADTNGSVFRTADAGESYEEIGIDDAGALTAVVSAPESMTDVEVYVAEDDGTVHRFDGTRWTPSRASEESLWALSADSATGSTTDSLTDSATRLVAVGDHGVVLDGTDERWETEETPTDESLRGVALGAECEVAVGDDGVIIER